MNKKFFKRFSYTACLYLECIATMDAQFFFFFPFFLDQVKSVLDDMLEKLPEEYSLSELMSKTVERSPYILVCLQECERMNLLLAEIHRSLKELDLGLKVEARRTINQTKQSVQLIPDYSEAVVFEYCAA